MDVRPKGEPGVGVAEEPRRPASAFHPSRNSCDAHVWRNVCQLTHDSGRSFPFPFVTISPTPAATHAGFSIRSREVPGVHPGAEQADEHQVAVRGPGLLPVLPQQRVEPADTCTVRGLRPFGSDTAPRCH